jgi:hypothetical protein
MFTSFAAPQRSGLGTRHSEEKIPMRLDTVFIEPDRYRFCLVWRGAVALSALTDNGIEQVAVAAEPLRARA